MQNLRSTIRLGASLAMLVLSGCAVTHGVDPKDPWEGWNRSTQSFNDGVDDYVMKPVAKGYDQVMPTFAHHAVTNFFSNIDDIDVFINDALQGKFVQSGEDTARLLVNTTAGIAGFIDVGTMIDLPKHIEDFDQTLGIWGVPTGPYLVLPFFGPSSPRGAAGLLGDAALNPISYTGIYFSSTITAYAVSVGVGGLKAIDTRANNLGLEKVINEAAIDRYAFLKNAYIQRRNYLVNDGNVPEEDVLDYYKKNVDDLGPVSPF
jgi:phospholipid-binding lipoprotein MlaA